MNIYQSNTFRKDLSWLLLDKFHQNSKSFIDWPILDPLLFNIYMNDVFFSTELTDECNYLDDTAGCTYDSDINFLVYRLGRYSLVAIEWFDSSYTVEIDWSESSYIVAIDWFESSYIVAI